MRQTKSQPRSRPRMTPKQHRVRHRAHSQGDILSIPAPRERETHVRDRCNLSRGIRIWKLNLHSACRNLTDWPTSAEWRIGLPTVMRNVSSVSISSVCLHASEFTVDVWNQFINIQLGGNVYTVEVPIGMYSKVDLATAVTAAFVATDPALASITVTYTSVTDSMTVSESTPVPFTLLWSTGQHANTSMARTLGFDQVDTASTLSGGSHVVSSSGRVDLDGVLAIDVFADELSNSMDGPVGRVLLERQLDGAPVFQKTPVEETHSFWPIGRLQFLTFRFMVQYGRVNQDGSIVCDYRPYQFHGKENTIRLDVGETTYINPLENEVQLDPGT